MTFHRPHRHLQHFGNLFRHQIFLIAEQHYHARFLRERRDQLAQTAVQQRVALPIGDSRLRGFFQSNVESRTTLANVIDAAPAGDLSQPKRYMPVAFQLVQLAMQPQKDVLRHLLCRAVIPQKMQGQAKHHRLIRAQRFRKVQAGRRLHVRLRR